jgi:very-short-patch-repair endonuclease
LRPADRYTRSSIEQRGWRSGTTFENRIAWRLCRHHLGPNDGCVQQHRVGKYRPDFAWPRVQVALEADGWHHLRPETAARDAERDRWLRAHGWLVFRVDDNADTNIVEEQIARVVQVTLLLLDRRELVRALRTKETIA